MDDQYCTVSARSKGRRGGGGSEETQADGCMRTYSYWAVQPSRKQPDPKPWSPRAWMEERKSQAQQDVRRESYWPLVRRDAKMFLFFATARRRAGLPRQEKFIV